MATDHQPTILEAQTGVSCRESSGGIIIYDKGDKVILSNTYVSRLFGYERDELIGMNIHHLILIKERHSSKKRAFAAAQPVWHLVGGQKRTGERLSVGIIQHTIDTGHNTFTVMFVADCGAESTASVENDMPLFFLLLDKDGNVLLINDYGQHLLGYGPEEFNKVNWFEKFLPGKRKPG